MAKPDCDDGWLKYAHELDAALALADFSKCARLVLREVFAQIFGPARAKTAQILPAEVARRSGQQRENVWRAIRELVESCVLRLEADGSYRFLKDYESWLGWARGGSSGQPRFTSEEISYCRHACAMAIAYKHGQSTGESIQRDTHGPNERIQRDTQYPVGYGDTVSNGIQNRIPPDTQTVSNETTPGVAPYRNARAELRIENGENVNVAPHGGGNEDPEEPPPSPEQVAAWEAQAQDPGQTTEGRSLARLLVANWRGSQLGRDRPPLVPDPAPAPAVPLPAYSQGKPRTKGRALLANLTPQSTQAEVDDAARSLASELKDEHSLLMYRKVLMKAVAGETPLGAIQAAYRMAKSPTTEYPGARFVSELKNQAEVRRDKIKKQKHRSQHS